jgi:hypothetical protein
MPLNLAAVCLVRLDLSFIVVEVDVLDSLIALASKRSDHVRER